MQEFDWKKQSHKEPLNSDKHQSMHNEHYQKRSRGKKGKAVFAFSVLTSLVASGVGFSYISNYQPFKESDHKKDVYVNSLRFVEQTNEIAMADPEDFQNSLQVNSSHRADEVHNKHYQELQQELQQTKQRLQQLKEDILIRGGKKETYYKELVAELELNLEDAEQQIQDLHEKLQEHIDFLESKNSENENLMLQYLDENRELKDKIDNFSQEYNEDIESSREEINLFLDELKLKNQEESVQYIEESIDLIRKKILTLENALDEAHAKIEIEEKKSKDFSEALEKNQSELLIAQKKITSLTNQLKEESERYATLENALHPAVNKAYSSARPLTDLDQLKIRLTGEGARASILEKQLQAEIGYKKSERERSIALQNELERYKNIYSAHDSKDPSEQDKLIKNLVNQLEISEAKNIQLQQRIEELEIQKPLPIKDRDEQNAKASLESHLQQTQGQIDKIESQILDHSSTGYDDFLLEEDVQLEGDQAKKPADFNEYQDLNKKLDALQMQNQQLKKEYGQTLQEKENLIQELNKKINTLQNNTTDHTHLQSNLTEEQIYQLRKSYESELRVLHNELAKTKQELKQFQKGEIIYNEEYFTNRVRVLESTLEAHKEALIAAQEEVLKSHHESGFDQKEEFFLSKIEALNEKNRILEKQLAESEDYLTITQEQMIGDQQNNLSLISLLEEKEKRIDNLQHEIDSIENGDFSLYFDKQQNEKILLEKVEALQLALNNEKQRTAKVENEIALLRDELVRQHSSASSNQIEDLLEQFEIEKTKNIDLQERYLAMSKWNERLQNELEAHESGQRIDLNLNTSAESDPSLLEKLKTKIRYLTTRIEQEQKKHNVLEEKIEEMGITFSEMQHRNTVLERKVRDAGLKLF